MTGIAAIRTKRSPLFFYFFVHSFCLLSAHLIPKIFKVWERHADLNLFKAAGSLIRDLCLVLSLELFLFTLCHFSRDRVRSWVALIWGLCLFPLLFFAIADLRFFLSTGSSLQWSVFEHGLRYFGELQSLLMAEVNALWWTGLAGTLPLALALSWWGYRCSLKIGKADRGQWEKLLAAFAFLALFAIAWPKLLRTTSSANSIYQNFYIDLIAQSALENAHRAGRPQDKLRAEFFLKPLRLEASTAEPFNIVIMVAESLRASATTPYRRNLDTTPFLRKLADRGMLVETGYTIIPHTTKSLIPIFCGIPPHITQALSETLPGRLPAPCLPELLKDLGYRSAFFQPAHSTFENRKSLVRNMGFQNFTSLEALPQKGFEKANYLGIEERAMIGPIMSWVAKTEQPFFLGVLTLLSHHDYKSPKTFKMKNYGGPARWSDYLNTVRYTDSFFQELYNEFEKLKLTERTLFIILGDHGEAFDEHSVKGHDNVPYEEGLRVAWLLFNPLLIPKPMVVKGPRQNLDILPTLVDLLGWKVNQGQMWGVSLLEPEDKVAERILRSACWWEKSCFTHLQNGGKYINQYRFRAPQWFDLTRDPEEKTNLIDGISSETKSNLDEDFRQWRDDIDSFYKFSEWVQASPYILKKKPQLKHRLDVRVGNHLEVLGYEMNITDSLMMDVNLKLAFKVLATMNWYWHPEISFVDMLGSRWPLRVESVIENEFPLYTWPPDSYVQIEFRTKIVRNPRISGTAFGPGKISIGFRQHKSGWVPLMGDGVDKKHEQIELPLVLGSS